MLDVIADFWKPVKKGQGQEKLQPEQIEVGSTLGFGFVPQALLSGRRLTVSAINTYQFGDEALTSFVLSQDKDAAVSMIVAESEGEHYLAISRRVSINDRSKLFADEELQNIMTKIETTRLSCRDAIADYKGWTVPNYKREIQGLRGRIFKGDFRKKPLPSAGEAQEFEYILLVSESNEHAIEIEKYTDGRIEVYATIYRRMNDIGEITHPSAATMDASRPDLKMPAAPAKAPEPKPVLSTKDTTPPLASSAPVMSSSPKLPEALLSMDEPKPLPIKLQEFAAPPAPAFTSSKPAEPEKPAPLPAKPEQPVAQAGLFAVNPIKEEKPAMMMPTAEAKETLSNGASKDMNIETMKPKLFVQPTAPETSANQEIKAVTNKPANSFENESIECDLRVANKIIDEAIRNEMRLTDVVRRIIELPVAYPESVQIPMTLTDEDYSLLAIRYGISSSDRNSIKRRIIEDLNDFSGAKKQPKAA